jgi:hypothetical protein
MIMDRGKRSKRQVDELLHIMGIENKRYLTNYETVWEKHKGAFTKIYFGSKVLILETAKDPYGKWYVAVNSKGYDWVTLETTRVQKKAKYLHRDIMLDIKRKRDNIKEQNKYYYGGKVCFLE